MVGRRPDPQAVRDQKRAVRSERKPRAEAAGDVVEIADGKAPGWLKGEALEIWQKRAPMLRAARLLSQTDELAFARYCYNFARWRKARGDLDKRGYTYDAVSVTGGKLRRVDPLFMVADRLERQLLAVEDRFGMNPAERQRIFMARSQKGGTLFDDPPPTRQAQDPAAQPVEVQKPLVKASGFLQ